MENLMSTLKNERIKSLDSKSREKLQILWESKEEDYQFLLGNKTKIYPEKKDVFSAKIPIGIEIFGIVLNNHISSKNGEDLIVVALYDKSPLDNKDNFNFDDMLIEPVIVDDNYWRKGLFVKMDTKIDTNIEIDYGFYRISTNSFCDEYGNNLEYRPVHLNTYGISTIHGVAFKTTEELIFRGIV